jgi:hypothetical protein
MQMSFREIVTCLHGVGFGGLLLLAFSGAFVHLYRASAEGASPITVGEKKLGRVYLISMAVLGWVTVLSGAYWVYPWYRAHPPEGVTDLSEYAQRSLIASPTTKGWHSIGMEWKEHVAWFAPIALTMVAYVFIKYGSEFSWHRQIRKAAFSFTLAAFVAAVIAGTFGALINKKAPIQGGAIIKLMEEAK